MSELENKKADSEEIPRTMGKFLYFLHKRIWAGKKIWLYPFWLLLAILALILLLSGNGAMLPAIYLAL
jgi:hypothetical protein